MSRRKRRQLKHKTNRGNDSSDILFIGIPLIVTMVLCCILVFGTFQRFKDVPVSTQYESSIETEASDDSATSQE